MWQSNPLRLILLALAVELHSCGGSPPAVFSLTHDLYEEGVKGLMTLVRLEVTTGTEHIVANLTDPSACTEADMYVASTADTDHGLIYALDGRGRIWRIDASDAPVGNRTRLLGSAPSTVGSFFDRCQNCIQLLLAQSSTSSALVGINFQVDGPVFVWSRDLLDPASPAVIISSELGAELRAKLGVPLAAASNALLSLDAAAAPQLARLRLLVDADTATVDSTTWLLSATVVLGANATLGAQSSVALSNPAADGSWAVVFDDVTRAGPVALWLSASRPESKESQLLATINVADGSFVPIASFHSNWTRAYGTTASATARLAFIKCQVGPWQARHRSYAYTTISLADGTVVSELGAHKWKQPGQPWVYDEGPKLGDLLHYLA